MNKRESKSGPIEISKYTSALVLICFFLSGLTGLIYEILWTRMIVKVIGSAPFAVSIILTVFMGGLGFGSYLASRIIDQLAAPQRLLRLYALLELAIGGYGIVLPCLIIAIKPLYSVLYNHLFNYFLLYNFLTLIGCTILLIIPVTCMGATLPILCRFYVVQLAHLGTRAGRLYALNTFGAAIGSLLCGFWLINLWDVWGTLSFAVLLNCFIGAHCLITSYQMKGQLLNLGRSAKNAKEVSLVETIPSESYQSSLPGSTVWILIIFAVSGFCAMAYEVIWTKLLGLIIGPTAYSFTIVLATFIIGLALGSLLFGRLADKSKRPHWLLFFTQLCAAFLSLGISHILGNSQLFFAKLIYHFKDQFVQLTFVKTGVLFGLMLGPTLCLGATFPLVGKIYAQSLTRVGRSIGFAYAINTLGAVLGSFCAGFLLIPWFGKEQSLSLVIAFQFLTALCIAGYLLWKKKASPGRWVPVGVTGLLGLILCFQFPYWDRQSLSMGRYHRFEGLRSSLENIGWLETLWAGPKILANYQANSELLYYGDGIGGFTTVMKEINGLGTSEYTLINSGKPDASSRKDMPTQTLLAHLPLLFHPDPKGVMVIGLASGVTAGEVLHYPIERLDVVEISEEVVSASNFFIPWNNKVLSNPKVELIIQDARAHLELTNRKYDIIISEPSNPWMAGLATLFTKEFFLLAKERLNKNGIFVQFFHSYQMDWDSFALIGRTFSQAFPHSVLLTTIPGAVANPRIGSDYVMMGFKGEDRLRVNHAEKNIYYAQQSKNITIRDPRVIYRLVVSEDFQKLFDPGPVHSDDWPLLEFAAPKQMHTIDPTIEINIWSKRWLRRETQTVLREVANVESQIAFASFALSMHQPFRNMVDLGKATATQKEKFFDIVEDYCAQCLIKDYSIFADQELKERCLSSQVAAIQNNIHLVPEKTVAYNYLGNAYGAKGDIQMAIESYQKALATDFASATAHANLGSAYFAKGMVTESISEYEKALQINPNLAVVRTKLGNAFAKKGMLDEAITEYKRALVINSLYAGEYHSLGGVDYGNKNIFDEATSEGKKVIVSNLNQAETYFRLGLACYSKNMFGEAISYYTQAIANKPNYAKAHHNLGVVYLNKGMLDKATAEFKQTLAINPHYAMAYNNLGNVYLKKGELEKAITKYKKTIAIKPDYAKAYNNLAIAYYYKKNYKMAIASLNTAIKLGSNANQQLLELLKSYL